MSILTQALGFIFVSLIVINGMLGGGVWDAIGTFATDEEKEQARLDIMCGTGFLMWTPTADVWGLDVPVPSYSNVIVAALIALSLILIIRVTTGIDWKFKYSIITFFTVWVLIKIFGYALMLASGQECMVWAEEMVVTTSGFYDVAAAGGALWGLKIVWGLRR